jgi:hypothetical protein
MHLIAGPIFELAGKLLEKSGVDYIPFSPTKARRVLRKPS